MKTTSNNIDSAIKEFDFYTSCVGRRSYAGEYSASLVTELKNSRNLKVVEKYYKEVFEDLSQDDFSPEIKIEMEALVDLLDKWKQS